MANRLPAKPKPGKLAKTDRVIDIIDYLASQKNDTLPLGEFDTPKNYKVTIIGQTWGADPAGGADFTDNRYWVRAMFIKKSGGATNQIEMLPDTLATDSLLIPVLNMAEVTGSIKASDPVARCTWNGPHGLPIGSFVECEQISDAGGLDVDGAEIPSIDKWVTWTHPKIIQRLMVSANEAGGGKYVVYDLNPPSTTLNQTANAASSDFGVSGTSQGTLINPAEIGGTTHSLSTGQVVWGELLQTRNTDGRRWYAMVGGAGGGGIDLRNNGTVAVSNAHFINIPATYAMKDILEFGALGDLQFRPPAVAYKVLQWNGTNFVFDYVRAHA